MSSEELPWVDAWDLLTATGARNLSRSGSELTFSCFSGNHSHGDATPSAGMNARTTRWRCRSPNCGLHGNAADYLAALKGYTRSEALRVLQERYGGLDISTEPGELEVEVQRIRDSYEATPESRIAPQEDDYLDRYALHWPSGSPAGLPGPMQYMLGRGFTAETLNDWSIGFDEHSDRVTIPVHDEGGVLVGIKGRAWRDVQPRYISLGHQLGQPLVRYPFHTYMKSIYVFGLHRAVGRSLLICEGELNVIALQQMGFENAVAVAGSEFSERQRQLIVSRAESAVILFDGDPAGQAGAEKVAEALTDHLPVWVVENAAGDPADALDSAKSVTRQDIVSMLLNATPWINICARAEC